GSKKMHPKAERYKRFFCSFSGCSASYNKQWKLDAHLCKHTGVKPHSCGHDGCGEVLLHSGLKPFQCGAEGCSEAFTTNEHKKYVCKFEGCRLEFKKNKQLKSHMCEQHTQLPSYQCTYEECCNIPPEVH
uniref:C2H2-type domain-containing protein n=1 Tax=Amphiprion percula TaxID=161767 RepID=A0A3P8SC33_AMPPE